MKYYLCDNDNCGEKVEGTEPSVVLKGITGTSGGILLPERFHKKHFCKPECFWQWVHKHRPNPAAKSLNTTGSTAA